MDILEEKLKNIVNNINYTMKMYFSEVRNIDVSLLESIKYSIFPGGKRLRPCIMIMFYEMFGKNTPEIYLMACALEMIHTYSLIHDDLPCMDNDEIRRGKKCTHIVYGEDIALLAGDALITEAFEILFNETIIEKFGYKTMVEVARILSHAAGSCKMVSGQAMEINIDKNTCIDKNLLLDIYDKKTGALFEASAKIGVLCADMDSQQINYAGMYGKCFGLAFQLYDDIIDVRQDGQNKTTYLSLCGEKTTKQTITTYISKAINYLNELKGDTANLNYLINKLSLQD